MKTIRVAAAVIREKNCIFAAARGYGEQKGGWEFPGGKIEPGETAQEALAREIKEELDTEIEVGNRISTLEYDYPAFHLSMDCFWCRIQKGELTPLEASDTRWLTKDRLYSVNWLPADLLLIPLVEAELGKETVAEEEKGSEQEKRREQEIVQEEKNTVQGNLKIRGAIFDLDGVLLDSLFIWKDLGERYLQKMGKTARPGLGQILFPMSLEEGAEYLKDYYPLEKTAEEICAELQQMIKHFYYYEVQSKPGAEDLLSSLREKGFRIQAATSGTKEYAQKALERNGLLQYIEKINTTAEAGEGKSSPRIFNNIAADMNCLPEEIVVIEDTLEALLTAKKAGFHVIGIWDPNGETKQGQLEKESEIYVKTLTELKPFL